MGVWQNAAGYVEMTTLVRGEPGAEQWNDDAGTVLRARASAPKTAPLILVIEDEPAMAESIQYSLELEGYRVALALDGQQGIDLFRAEVPALIVLDLMLPRLSGLDVCRIVRSESAVPVIILTAKDSEADKVAGLELGGDDYVTKPFSMRELISRVRAHRRRIALIAGRADLEVLRGGGVELDGRRHEVRVRGKQVAMTPKEFDLLRTFLTAKGRLRTRDYLIAEVWGTSYFGDTKTLDVHIKRLRKKIERDPHHPENIITVRGLGYRFLDEPSRADPGSPEAWAAAR